MSELNERDINEKKLLGALGLAIATAISIGVIALLILISAKRKIKEISYKAPIILFLKTTVASLVMFATLYALTFLNRHFALLPTDLFYGKLILLVGCIAIGIAVYVLSLLLMKTSELRELIGIFLRRKRKS